MLKDTGVVEMMVIIGAIPAIKIPGQILLYSKLNRDFSTNTNLIFSFLVTYQH
jgi:hypothetical protein